MDPLAGLRVLEFEAIGPWPSAMMLADMGADVLLAVDIERLGELGLGLADQGADAFPIKSVWSA